MESSGDAFELPPLPEIAKLPPAVAAAVDDAALAAALANDTKHQSASDDVKIEELDRRLKARTIELDTERKARERAEAKADDLARQMSELETTSMTLHKQAITLTGQAEKLESDLSKTRAEKDQVLSELRDAQNQINVYKKFRPAETIVEPARPEAKPKPKPEPAPVVRPEPEPVPELELMKEPEPYQTLPPTSILPPASKPALAEPEFQSNNVGQPLGKNSYEETITSLPPASSIETVIIPPPEDEKPKSEDPMAAMGANIEPHGVLKARALIWIVGAAVTAAVVLGAGYFFK